MDRPGLSAALTPSSAGVASPPECLSGAAADERYRTRSGAEAPITVVDPAEGSVVNNASQFSHFSAVGRAFGIQAVSSDLASSDKEVASGTCAEACPGAAHMDVTLPAESDGLGSQDNRVASVRCDAGSLVAPPAVPPATPIQDELCPITLVRTCTLVRPEMVGLVLPPFTNSLKTSVVEFRKWQKKLLEFQEERNLNNEYISYLLWRQLVGPARLLIEDLSAVDADASDGLPRMWMRLGRVFDCPPLER